MFLRELKQPVTRLKGAGDAAAAKLARLGITTVASLLCHYPWEWEDRSRPVPLKDWMKGRICTEVTVLAQDWFGYGAMRTLKIYVEDESARASLACFHRPHIGKMLEVGTRWRLFGKFYFKRGEIQSSDFDYEPLAAISSAKSRGLLNNPIMPVYHLTEGIKMKPLRKLTSRALEEFSRALEDELPPGLIARDGLFHKRDAVRAIHFPMSWEERDRARKTLKYEELFYLEVMVGRRAIQRKKIGIRKEEVEMNISSLLPPSSFLTPLQRRLLERLPFPLTPGQEAAVKEINQDMDGPFPMARLLQGDVGSGKTLVSFLAALKAVEGGGQAALMAPTELLARQHAENAALLLEPLGIRLAFLTGNIKAAGRAQLLKALAAGEIDVVAGTHALFSKDVAYNNLSFVVVDEQHRFGVLQRQAIMAKGRRAEGETDQGGMPDLLMMSATPIPRSLALTVFGDLDVSVIRDMPPGRKPVKTHLATQSNEAKVYNFVRKELEAGRQAYFVYPLIEGGDENVAIKDGGLKDAVSMAERLSKEIFPKFPLKLLHSRIDDEEKRLTMDAFRRGDIKILAATSVVEVGVDVPNASCMVVEHAERFGLSALHQLRGRVGRGRDQAYCFLIYSDQDEELRKQGINPQDLSEEERSPQGKRLMVMLENTDGFVIAEKDLLFRGPGQISGLEQSGYLQLGIADPVKDAVELVRARTDAFAILEADPGLETGENRVIAEVLERATPFGEVGL
jgi:ATP-dependent DNA helicase RecG